MRIILVSGANGGLGTAIAQTFLKESPENFVWLGVHRRREQAEKLAGEYSLNCACIELNVTQPAAWKQAVKQILAEHNRLDVLVNNAGKHHDGLLANLSGEGWDAVLATNLNATFHGCQAVLAAMISQRSGRIVNIASLSALLAPAGQTNYAAATSSGRPNRRIGTRANAALRSSSPIAFSASVST